MRKFYIAIALFFVFSSNAKLQANEIELFAKEDAKAVFQMTRSEWNNNVSLIHQSGASQGMGEPDTGYSLTTTLPSGYIVVSPMYAREERPNLILITIAYKEPYSKLMTLKVLNESIELATSQMLPEYLFLGKVEKINEGTFLYAVIMPVGVL